MDIVDIIKNTKSIYMSESSLETMMDIERVIDSLDIYAFKNWKKGELVEGPIRKKHWVEASFMWPKKLMPDPDGAKRLLGYNAKVTFRETTLATPVQVEDYSDFRPGTKKPKLREDPVWVVNIKLPIELIKEFRDGYMDIEGEKLDIKEIDDAYEEGLDQTELTNMNKPEDEVDAT
tara:strand:- start:26 stop:553 length:528 start_codon:yes stop_codon:yes gene_type:complete